MSNFVFIIIVLLFIGLTVYGWWYKSPQQKGKRGEAKISHILLQLPQDYHVLDDVVLRKGAGTTQIDHVVVSKYGIFVIETKNYRGEIYGDDNRKEWTQIIGTDVRFSKKWWKTYTYIKKNKFYNPVKQSLGHAFAIKELIPEYAHVKIVPIVVFAGDAFLTNVKSSHHVIYKEDLLSVIYQYKTIYLSDDLVSVVLAKLQGENVREVVTNKEHVKNIRVAQKEVNATIRSGICPKCGGNLVPRKGTYGVFYGCSNYPKCKFTTH